MKPTLPSWVTNLSAAKELAKEAHKIAGDADLAAVVSETLQRSGMNVVNRAAINHWLNGVRQPNVPQFLALCEALKVSPADILSDKPHNVVSFQAREPDPPPWPTLDPKSEEIITDIRRADPVAQGVALAVAKAALEKSTTPHKRKRG